jgi:hypothetical protein
VNTDDVYPVLEKMLFENSFDVFRIKTDCGKTVELCRRAGFDAVFTYVDGSRQDCNIETMKRYYADIRAKDSSKRVSFRGLSLIYSKFRQAVLNMINNQSTEDQVLYGEQGQKIILRRLSGSEALIVRATVANEIIKLGCLRNIAKVND